MRILTKDVAPVALAIATAFLMSHSVSPQSPLSDEKKEKLMRLDPADLLPNAGEKHQHGAKSRQPDDSGMAAGVNKRNASGGPASWVNRAESQRKKPSPTTFPKSKSAAAGSNSRSSLAFQSAEVEIPRSPIASTGEPSPAALSAVSPASGSMTGSDSADLGKGALLPVLMFLIAIALTTLIIILVKLRRLMTRAN
jgi:hypothetical protein